MNILCFDTCLDRMYVALGNDKKLLSSKIVENTQTHYHSAFLISTIKQILQENNLKPDDINLLATNIGPGSFTGIRACVTVARIFAQAKNIDICPVSSLEIMSKLSTSSRILTALDARKNSVYTAAYENNNCIMEPQVMLLKNFELLLHKGYDIITDKTLSELYKTKSYQTLEHDFGKFLYEIALTKKPLKWSLLEPLYLQPPPVSIKK